MTGDWAQAWHDARNVLCVRLDSLGDVLMTEPAIRALKAGCHQAPPLRRTGRGSGGGVADRRITLLTSPEGAEAVPLIPAIDDVLLYRAPWMKRQTGSPDEDIEFIGALGRRGFDAAVIFTVYSQNPLPAALALYLAGVPLRLAHCRENPYHLLTHWLPEPEPHALQRHEVQRQLDLVAAIGCETEDRAIQIHIAEEHRAEAAQLLAATGIESQRPWIIVHPGASASSRRYDPGSFAEAIRLLRAELGLQIVLTGSTAEGGLLAAICQAADLRPGAAVTGASTGALAALIDAATLLLANNTGPVHLAAGTGTPVVDLYALTNPQHTPWEVPHRVLNHDVPCRWCYSSVCPQGHHACLALVSPSEVAAAVKDLLLQSHAV